jgi:hypothetical protein
VILRHAQALAAGLDDVAAPQLAPAAGLGLAVDPHVAGGEERLDLGAGVDRARELEQLAEPDAVVADGHVALHAPSMARVADSRAMKVLAIDDLGFGITWVLDEAMQRASHALATDGRVWFVDPVDVPDAVDRALALGEPAGVLQLLDRHPRDCRALAERFGVPHLRLPGAVPGSPFEAFDIVKVPRWHEVGLWWPEHRALVVPETVGAGPMFRHGDTPAGIHLFLRLRPPGTLRRFTPEHLLMGHGRPVSGPGAASALQLAYQRSLRDLPGVAVRLPFAFRR